MADLGVTEEPDPVTAMRSSVSLRSVAGAAGAGAFGLLGAGITELSHRRRLAGDPEHVRLLNPLEGAPVWARSADGTMIYGEVFGPDGAPTFVLAPGWTETLAYFDSMTRELLDAGFRVVAYDLRGQGKSAPAAGGDWNIDRYGEDLEAMLKSSSEGRHDVMVAGHSMGAMSIVAWARHHDVAARVRGVVLMNTGLTGLIRACKILPQMLPEAIAVPLGKWAFMGNAVPMPAFSTALSRSIIRYVAFGPYASDPEVTFYERMLVACPPRVRAHAGLSMTDMDLFDGLPQITVPTLVLSGRLDRLTPPAHAERISVELPNLVRLVEIPGIGHMGPLESPHQLVMALLELAAAAERTAEKNPLEPAI